MTIHHLVTFIGTASIPDNITGVLNIGLSFPIPGSIFIHLPHKGYCIHLNTLKTHLENLKQLKNGKL